MKREEFLERVKSIVCTDRNRQYGEPEENFGLIVGLWTEYLRSTNYEVEIYPHDVAMLVILFKVARAATAQDRPTEDTFLDIAGYAACGVECLE